MSRFISGGARRLVDISLIAVTAPIWVPVIGAVSAAVLVTSGRPVFFNQERVGRNGETFSMRKFRSMRNGENPVIPDPGRITAIGAILRRTSLDELPQLINVLDGSMSLVGPRPLLPEQLSALSSTQLLRFTVRPGLTGLAQVNGRNELSWDERFEFDLEWAKRPTLRRYLSILAQTRETVVSGEGIEGHDHNDRVIRETTEGTSSPAGADQDVVFLDEQHLDLDAIGRLEVTIEELQQRAAGSRR